MKGKMGRHSGSSGTSASGPAFNIKAPDIKHTRYGVWDLYSQKSSSKVSRFPFSSYIEAGAQALDNMPYVWRMLRDVFTIPSCWYLLIMYGICRVLLAFLPAVTLWWVFLRNYNHG